MMKVESLKKNNQRNYTVTLLDDVGQLHSYVVSEDLVVNHRLIKGKELDETTFRHFEGDYEIDALLIKTISLISRSPKTIHETKAYLQRLNTSEKKIKMIISKLISERFLDDETYALLYLERSFHLNGHGPNKIDYDLMNKGISDKIRQSLLSTLSNAMIQTNLNHLFDKKLPTLKSKSKSKSILLMKQYLYQKGYDLNLCDDFVTKRSHLFGDDETELKALDKDYVKINKRLAKANLTPYELHQKILSNLMGKGYRYDTIKQYIEGRKS